MTNFTTYFKLKILLKRSHKESSKIGRPLFVFPPFPPTPEYGAKTDYFAIFLPKSTWRNWIKIGRTSKMLLCRSLTSFLLQRKISRIRKLNTIEPWIVGPSTVKMHSQTSMHSCRMRTARRLTVMAQPMIERGVHAWGGLPAHVIVVPVDRMTLRCPMLRMSLVKMMRITLN